MNSVLLFEFERTDVRERHPDLGRYTLSLVPGYGVVTSCWTTNGSFGFVARNLFSLHSSGLLRVPREWEPALESEAILREALRSAYEKTFPEYAR